MNPVLYFGLLLLVTDTFAYIQEGPSSLSVYALRLGPGEEIVTSLFKFVQEKNLRAPFIITCVGSVTKATLRLANADALNTNECLNIRNGYLNANVQISITCRFVIFYSSTFGKFEIIHLKERFEIVSLVGTLNEAAHLHISLSDKDGKTIGGHAMGDLEVFTTAEIVIGELNDLQFTREMDERTGFPELVISPFSRNTSSA